MRSSSKVFGVVALLFALSAGAQTGVITGTLSDASTKQPLADVVVTATAPGVYGEQVVVTDATGQYRIPDLPAGHYTLRFEKEGFERYTRSGVQLREGRTIRVQIEIFPEGILTGSILIGPCTPAIDLSSTSTGVDVDSDDLRFLPLVPPH